MPHQAVSYVEIVRNSEGDPILSLAADRFAFSGTLSREQL